MLTDDHELLIEMIDHIDDKEENSKFIRKIMEQKFKQKPNLQFSNAYKFKDIVKQFETQNLVTIQDLQQEIKQIRMQIRELKEFTQNLDLKIQQIETQGVYTLTPQKLEDLDNFVNTMTIVENQRWYNKITLKIKPDYQSSFIALIKSGTNLNCKREGLIPTVYFIKTIQRLSTTSNVPVKVQYKIPKGNICKDGICIKTSFLLVKNISHQIVLGTPFLTQLYPFKIDSKGLQTYYKNQPILFDFIKGVELKEINQIQDKINLLHNKQQQVKFLQKEIQYKKTEENLKSKQLQDRIHKSKNILRTIYVLQSQMLSGTKNNIWYHYHMKNNFLKNKFQQRQDPYK